MILTRIQRVKRVGSVLNVLNVLTALMQLLSGYPRAGDKHPTPKPRKEGRVIRIGEAGL